MDVGAWLRTLGLEQYEQAFRDNAIDTEILPRLTAEDLKDMGVTVVGHRRKLLHAIDALEAGHEAARPPPPNPAATPPAAKAERRQLTVLFADLVGSTELSARLDPEEMRQVLRAYQDAVAGEILRFGGHIAKFMGDGVLAYFGWPLAHEDAAERAVQAGLAATAVVRRLEAPTNTPLAARVGIATGLVVVGDLVGEGTAREEAVVGETPNLAARLQASAEPGQVVIGGETPRLVGGLFKLQALDLWTLKGLAGPVPAFTVLGPGAAESRFEALHGTSLTSLFGREEELELLLRRWTDAEAGEGQVVLLAGEPGVGKSRLMLALRERLANHPHLLLGHYCSPLHQTSPLYPVVGQLERAAGFARDDTPDERFAKLEALLADGAQAVAHAAPLIAALLALPESDRYPAPVLSPRRQKERTLEVLIEQLAGLTQRRPILAIYEDVHWADPTTLELLDLVVERVRSLPALVLVTFRPEFAPRWAGSAHVTSVTLRRLPWRQGQALVQGIAGGKSLPPEVLGQIVAKADGVPLFAEELTKAVLETNLLRDAGDHYELTGPLPPLAIPSTLHDSLMARLDRLPPVREVAQIGATIGREFSHELLAAVAPLSENELRHALEQLIHAELVFRRGTPPASIYSFKHALVRDAAYQTLLKSTRQQLHTRLVQVLEERFPETAETKPELLAQHCVGAGQVEKAVRYWHEAGQLTLQRSATAEAIAQLTAGMELLAGLPDGQERRRQELDLQVSLAGALVAAKGFAAPEVGQTWTRARELCRELPDVPPLVRVLNGQFFFHIVRAELAAALDVAEELLRLAGQGEDATVRLIGHRAAGIVMVASGRLARGREHLEQALAIYDPARHGGLALHHVFDPRVGSLCLLAFGLFALGHPTQALHRSDEAVRQARQLRHPFSLALALFFSAALRQLLGGREDVLDRADELLAVASEQDFRFWRVRAELLRGWGLASTGLTQEGLALLRRALIDYGATGSGQWLPYFLALFAEAEGPGAKALELLDDGLSHVQQTGERWFEAELHRRKGEALLALSAHRIAEAEACISQALTVAREQDARMWELRAATSLARVWRDQGKCTEARDLLTPIHLWFTEGFDTPDLQKAKALLNELSANGVALRATA